jgi:hypothetical protein
MSTYEYHIVINDAQRRLIMRALTNALANDRHSTEALRPMPYEWMQLIRLFGRPKSVALTNCKAARCYWRLGAPSDGGAYPSWRR